MYSSGKNFCFMSDYQRIYIFVLFTCILFMNFPIISFYRSTRVRAAKSNALVTRQPLICRENHVSLCIPSFNRYEFLLQSLPHYLVVDRIFEVIVSDDLNSDDVAKLRVHLVQNASFSENIFKLKLHSSTTFLGALRNKLRCVDISSCRWVGIVDSDNFASNALYWSALPNALVENVIYLPEILMGTKWNFNFIRFQFGTISKLNWPSVYSFNSFAHNVLFNTGNFVVPKSVFPAWNALLELSNEFVDGLGPDVYFLTHQAMCADFVFKIVENMTYFHRVHAGSIWLTNEVLSNQILTKYTNVLKSSDPVSCSIDAFAKLEVV